MWLKDLLCLACQLLAIISEVEKCSYHKSLSQLASWKKQSIIWHRSWRLRRMLTVKVATKCNTMVPLCLLQSKVMFTTSARTLSASYSAATTTKLLIWALCRAVKPSWMRVNVKKQTSSVFQDWLHHHSMRWFSTANNSRSRAWIFLCSLAVQQHPRCIQLSSWSNAIRITSLCMFSTRQGPSSLCRSYLIQIMVRITRKRSERSTRSSERNTTTVRKTRPLFH